MCAARDVFSRVAAMAAGVNEPAVTPEPRGMGDVVAVVAEPIARVVGLENCGGCKKRRADWNREMPFGGEPEAGTVV